MNANVITVFNFLHGTSKTFTIPVFQRNYAWGKEECKELFEDIEMSVNSGMPHYLGNIVYYMGQATSVSHTEIILIDGQQRITTLLILLCVLRDKFSNNNVVTEAQEIQNDFLVNRQNSTNIRANLKQTQFDKDAFEAIVNSGNAIVNNNSQIFNNYHLLTELVDNLDLDKCRKLYEAIKTIELVEINLQINDDFYLAQTIFEKINSTGKPLTAADLIRNYLLLVKDTQIQESLFNDKWTPLEKTVQDKNISRFARDYLVMKTYNYCQTNKIYLEFKKYCDDYKRTNNFTNAHILDDMNKYAKYYSWFLEETCPDKNLNWEISLLNSMQTDDLYPLLLFLFDSLYINDRTLLLSIVKLLSDFIIRYRIVAPYKGGGALQSAIASIIKTISTTSNQVNYDSILFLLSNSSSPTNRFPNDDEFKDALSKYVSTNNARPVLLRIEYFQTKNTVVPIKDVTVEHLMPQTLSPWWENHLGIDFEEIHQKYLHCIGNMAPISGPYNSSISNKPWDEKTQSLKNAQFSITSKVANSMTWKQGDITLRNGDIVNYACKAISGPKERTVPYSNKKNSQWVTINIDDPNTNLTGRKISYLLYNSKDIAVKGWNYLLKTICEITYQIDKQKFDEIVTTNAIHKSSSIKNNPNIKNGKDPIIATDTALLTTCKKIDGSKYYCEATLSAQCARKYSLELLNRYGITNNFQITIS